ncbi:MAG: histidine kinase, partial [Calothrix sp. SM1_7_51]|nr:histidine kinase [Calothrix sp. SM1_7_51]
MHNFNGMHLRNSGIYGSDLTVAKTASAFATLAAFIAIFVGSLVLLGWQFDIDIIKSGFSSSGTTIKVNTALCFIFSGVSLLLLPKEEGLGFRERLLGEMRKYSLWGLFLSVSPSLIAKCCGFLVFLVGLVTLGEYSFGWDFGIDQLFLPDSTIVSWGIAHPGRMGLNKSLNFVFIGLALQILSEQRGRWSYYYAQILVLVASLISLLALV